MKFKIEKITSPTIGGVNVDCEFNVEYVTKCELHYWIYDKWHFLAEFYDEQHAKNYAKSFAKFKKAEEENKKMQIEEFEI